MNLDTQHWFCSPSVCGQSWQFYLNKQPCLCNCCGLDSWPAPKEKLPGKWKEKISSGYQLLTTLIQINDQTWSGLSATPLHHRPDKHTHNCWEEEKTAQRREMLNITTTVQQWGGRPLLWTDATASGPRLLLLFILLLLHHHPLLPPPMTIHPEIALWKRKKHFFSSFTEAALSLWHPQPASSSPHSVDDISLPPPPPLKEDNIFSWWCTMPISVRIFLWYCHKDELSLTSPSNTGWRWRLHVSVFACLFSTRLF